MRNKINKWKEERAKIVDAQRKLYEEAKENGELSAEQREKFEKMEADFEELSKKIEEAERDLKVLDTLEKRVSDFKDDPSDRAGIRPEPSGDGNVSPRATEAYRNAFWRAMRYTRNALDAVEIRALQVGTDSEGGYLVPTEFEKTLIQALNDQNIMRGLATVITSASDRQIPVVSSHGAAYWTAEEAAFTEGDDAFAQITLSAYKAATIIKVSEELLQDSAFNLDQYIANEFGRRIGALEEAAYVNGDGSGKPTGVIGGGTVGVTAASASAITSDELIDLFHALSRPYRARATWLMADSTAKVIRKLKDSDNQYLWQPGLQAGQPDRLLGRPVAISDSVPAIAASAKVIAFGDYSYYWIADRGGRVFQRLNELYAANGQVGFRAFERTDGKLTLSTAVQVLQMASS